jgi:hypothetical protein
MKIPNLVIRCDPAADLCGTILASLILERNRKELRENTAVALDSLFKMVDDWYEIYQKNLKAIESIEPEVCRHDKSQAMREYWGRRKISEEKYRTSCAKQSSAPENTSEARSTAANSRVTQAGGTQNAVVLPA